MTLFDMVKIVLTVFLVIPIGVSSVMMKYETLAISKGDFEATHTFPGVPLTTQCAGKAKRHSKAYFKHSEDEKLCEVGDLDISESLVGDFSETVWALDTSNDYPNIDTTDPLWYEEHYAYLTRNVNGPISKRGAHVQAVLILPNTGSSNYVFPVAVNGANQPTIVAGFYKKGRFVLSGNWEEFYEPNDANERALAENAVMWLARGEKELGDIKVIVRDYTKLSTHNKQSDPNYVSPLAMKNSFSDYDVYAAFSGSYGGYEWPADEVEAVLEWVGDLGKGLLLVGVIDWAGTPEDLFKSKSVNRIASQFGVLFSYKNAFSDAYIPGPEPPGKEAFFYPGHFDLIAQADEGDRTYAKLVASETSLVLHRLSGLRMLSFKFEKIMKMSGSLLSLLNDEESTKEFSALVSTLLPIYVGREDLLQAENIPAAWNSDEIDPGAEEIHNQTIIFQESTMNSYHLDQPVWFPTGYYSKPGKVSTFYLDGPIVNSGAIIQIGQNFVDVPGVEVKMVHRRFTTGIALRQEITENVHILGQPWGGPIYIVVPAMTEISESSITFDGVYEMVTFKLDEMTDQDFVTEVGLTKVPWVDLQAPGWISFTITRDFARSNILEPTNVMQFWKDKMQVVTTFAGYGNERPWMETFVFGPDEYDGSIMDRDYHEWVALATFPRSMEVYLDLDLMEHRDILLDSPYYPYHEIAHWHTWPYHQVSRAECMEDWFASVMVEATNNLGKETLMEEASYILSKFNSDGRGFLGASYDFNHRICIYTHFLLAEEYGWGSFTTAMNVFREIPSLQTLSLESRLSAWAAEYSRAISGNACEHFSWFNWPINGESMTVCQGFSSIPNLVEPYLYDQPKAQGVPSCDPDWVAVEEACFFVSDGYAANWADADTKCQDLGARVATCLSKDEMYRFSYMHQYNTLGNMPKFLWIGIHDKNSDFKLHWVNGGEIDHTTVPFNRWSNPYLPSGVSPDRSAGECGFYDWGMIWMGRCSWDGANYLCKKGGNTC